MDVTSGSAVIELPTNDKSATREALLKFTDSFPSKAFYIVDLGDVARKFKIWGEALPRVVPFYAVKCNNNPKILDTLVALGSSFDCASRAEIEAVISRGVAPANIIYANPCKPVTHLAYAREVGVRAMTFDNAEELDKIKEYYPDAELVLRVLADDSYSVCRLGAKFGVRPGQTHELLLKAKELGLNVIGVSFHVGSGCARAGPFADAVLRAKNVFDEATALGFKMTLLDVGGGFPGTPDAPVSFDEIAVALRAAIDEHFPPSSGIKIIGEPGRYMVASAATLAVNILARRTVIDPPVVSETTPPQSPRHSPTTTPSMASKRFMYYVTDGVYGAFNCTIFDHYEVTPKVLLSKRKAFDPAVEYDCSIWGPTCDSMDCVTKSARLPELAEGDWLYFENMGAYTFVCSTTFNGFSLAVPIYAKPPTLA